ncbi:hypothetical protein VT06_07305 [Arsukibacterium sp. MJ3]|uniref:sugar-transfer associated ATP-grasp domain-containing protein n=1 Tax=Arsukibacterium sp. MJ3 TaxID=1632859 RepID=UPI0006271B0C|nr:sugar-transfer associated ATP-grasp domain-containing protein [Arsukibacterium sp. MJ3]KKO49312.1 hypothetical protein VT06_07305 [Arsukibacterium sp. MJ3]
MTKFFSKIKLAFSNAYFVKQEKNRGYIAQLLDVVVLYRLNPTCNIFDYYNYQVYNSARGSSFYYELVGEGAQEAFNRSLNPRNAVAPAWDKLLFAVLCNAYNIRTTEILAIYKPTGIVPSFVKNHLTDMSQLKAYLQSEKGPIFVKPVKGSLGQGAFYIAGVDKNCNYVIDKCGDLISFGDFISKTIDLAVSHRYQPKAGVLLQRPVVQHTAITDFTQTSTPSGLRILVLNTGAGPYIHRVTWKIITSNNFSDNFSKGKHGNMLSMVDPNTGKVSDAVNNYWPTTKLHQKHPLSGNDFSGFILPLWQQVKAEVLRASSMINDMRAMHWDLIISEQGAIFLELNDLGGTNILQLHGKGLIDQELKKVMKEIAALQKGSPFARFILS